MLKPRLLLLLVTVGLVALAVVSERTTEPSQQVVVYLNAYWQPVGDELATYLEGERDAVLITTPRARDALCATAPGLSVCSDLAPGSATTADDDYDRIEKALEHLDTLLDMAPPKEALFVLPRLVDDRKVRDRLQRIEGEIARRGLATEVELATLGSSDLLGNWRLPSVRINFPSVVTPHETTFEGSIVIAGAAHDVSVEVIEVDHTLTETFWRLDGTALKRADVRPPPRVLSQARGESLEVKGELAAPTEGQAKRFAVVLTSTSTGDLLRAVQHTVTSEKPEFAVLTPSASGQGLRDPVYEFLSDHGINPLPLYWPKQALTGGCEVMSADLTKWSTVLVGSWFDDGYATSLLACVEAMLAEGRSLPRLLFVGLPRAPGSGQRTPMAHGWRRFLSSTGVQLGSERRVVFVCDGSASMDVSWCEGRSRLQWAVDIAEQIKQGVVESATSGLIHGECENHGCSGKKDDAYYKEVFKSYGGTRWEASHHIDRIHSQYRNQNISDVIAFWMTDDLRRDRPVRLLTDSANSKFHDLHRAGVRFWVIGLSDRGLHTQNSLLDQSDGVLLECGAIDARVREVKDKVFSQVLPRIQLSAGKDLTKSGAQYAPLHAARADPHLRLNNNLLAATAAPAPAKTLIKAEHWSGQGPASPFFVLATSGTPPTLVDVGYLALDLEGEYVSSVVADADQRRALSRLAITAITSFAQQTERSRVTWRAYPGGAIELERNDSRPFRIGARQGDDGAEANDFVARALDATGREIEVAQPNLDSLFVPRFEFPEARRRGKPFLVMVDLVDVELGVIKITSPFVSFGPELMGSSFAQAVTPATGEPASEAGEHESGSEGPRLLLGGAARLTLLALMVALFAALFIIS